MVGWLVVWFVGWFVGWLRLETLNAFGRNSEAVAGIICGKGIAPRAQRHLLRPISYAAPALPCKLSHDVPARPPPPPPRDPPSSASLSHAALHLPYPLSSRPRAPSAPSVHQQRRRTVDVRTRPTQSCIEDACVRGCVLMQARIRKSWKPRIPSLWQRLVNLSSAQRDLPATLAPWALPLSAPRCQC